MGGGYSVFGPEQLVQVRLVGETAGFGDLA